MIYGLAALYFFYASMTMNILNLKIDPSSNYSLHWSCGWLAHNLPLCILEGESNLNIYFAQEVTKFTGSELGSKRKIYELAKYLVKGKS
jgi:hypothetical protein